MSGSVDICESSESSHFRCIALMNRSPFWASKSGSLGVLEDDTGHVRSTLPTVYGN